MTLLDSLIPTPRLVEVNSVELAAPPHVVWGETRHVDLASSPLSRALFLLRTLPSRLSRTSFPLAPSFHIDDMKSSLERPGFQVLGEEPGHFLLVGAIGKVWQLDITYHHVDDIRQYQEFSEPGWVKVAWEVRIEPRPEGGTFFEVEIRVDTTDAESWERFKRYWLVIGQGSHFIVRVLLANLKARFGQPELDEEGIPLAGDAALPDAGVQATHNIIIVATPTQIWPWLLQMGVGRAGFYAVDILDNGGRPSAKEIHPELQSLTVGQIVPASPGSKEGFEVLAIDPGHALVLGGLYDTAAGHQLPFSAERPREYWHVTWSFVLERLTDTTTRLHVRARAAFSQGERLHLSWIVPVHHLMQTSQLRHLAERAEGRSKTSGWTDVASGLVGASVIAASLATPFLRSRRKHWGLSAAEADATMWGDEYVPSPSWSWTHAVDIHATKENVWPWVAQLGADRAGFYSYQWLENLVGCELHNAEAIHPEWQLTVGDDLVLHPQMPPLPIVALEPGRGLIAFASAGETTHDESMLTVSWALIIEDRGPQRCRLISRFRTRHSRAWGARLVQGPGLLEPIGFAMDRRMLLGIAARAEALQQRMQRGEAT